MRQQTFPDKTNDIVKIVGFKKPKTNFLVKHLNNGHLGDKGKSGRYREVIVMGR